LTGSVWAHLGFGIVVDRHGRIVFLDSVRSRVWAVDGGGRLVALATDKHGDNLVLDPNGNLFVENTNASLWKIVPDGKVTEVNLPGQGRRGVGSLDELLAVDRSGNFYFAAGNAFIKREPQLLKMTPDGRVSNFAGSTAGHADGKGSQAKFKSVTSAAWGPDGSLYVTDGNAVRKVAPDGAVTTVASGLGVEAPAAPPLGELLGLTVDARGNVYVADSGKKCVWRIAPQGEVTAVMTSQSPWVPVGVAVAEAQSGAQLYVLERRFYAGAASVIQSHLMTCRVAKVAPEGKTTILVTVK
jgi:sugar lactone lactonase YvrE